MNLYDLVAKIERYQPSWVHGKEAATAVSMTLGQRWLTVTQAARYMGLATPGGRAPTSTYEVAREIGSLVGNRWLIHSDDLDEWIRQQGRGRAA